MPPITRYSIGEMDTDLMFLFACTPATWELTTTGGLHELTVVVGVLGQPDVRRFIGIASHAGRVDLYNTVRAWLVASPHWAKRAAALERINARVNAVDVDPEMGCSAT